MGDNCCSKKQKAASQQLFNPSLESSFKVVLLGDTNVGKSSIALKFSQNQFNTDHNVTIGGAYQQFTLTLNNSKKVKLHLWDTGGEERFRSMLKLYYHDAKAILIVYDVSQPSSFESIQYWLNELKEKATNDQIIIYLVANKIDLPVQQILVSSNKAKEKYLNNSEFDIKLFETSAQTGKNINELFKDLGENLYKQFLENKT